MRTEKSTNGRSKKDQMLAAARVAARVLDGVSPSLAGRWASWLFFKAPRHRASDEEKSVLATADASWLAVGGHRLRVWAWGRGPRVLLVHGWGGRGGQLHELVAPLVAAGHRVIAFDGPGHGESSGSSSSLPEMSRAVAAVAAAEGPLRAMVTHSLGGPAAAMAIAEGLRVERMAAVAPPADASTWVARLAEALGISAAAREALRARVEARAGRAIGEMHVSKLAPRLRVPMLVVHDREDREVAWSDGAAVARYAGGSLLTTTGLGHQRILRDPDVLRSIVDFVGVAPRQRSSLELELFDRRARWAQVAALGG